MAKAEYDAIVVGGGPGGASTATVLAMKGRRVLLLEKERFPRFHIGESLLPAAWDSWNRLGVTADIEAAGFTVKQGVNFGMFQSNTDIVLLTAEFPEYFQRPYTFHVERSHFDRILLDNARRCGVEVREGWRVTDVMFDGTRAAGIMAGASGTAPRMIHAPVIVDATGRACLIARKFGWRRPDPALNKFVHFTHFTGAYRRHNEDARFDDSTMTDIHTIEDGWVWYIPLAGDVVSVGAVLDAKWARRRKGPQPRFDAAIANCPTIARWLEGARQKLEMQTISNISYLNDRFVGEGFVLVGDASMFVDPIFSAGVTLALRGGIFAADAIDDALTAGDVSAARLEPYEARIRVPMTRIFRMIYNWYRILETKNPDNIFTRSRKVPLLREQLIVLLSGGYDRVDLDAILSAAGEDPAGHPGA
ncbi:MAG: NAD(P)/FAD-dependent oxidoreductase [Methylococcales bacterium]